MNDIKSRDIWENKYIYLPILILIALYPLRWTFMGIDLWDTGYSCGNYVNFNTLSVSRPWFFSTFLSLFTGHMLSLLPYGNTLAGLKAYCSLSISIMVVVSGLFCIRRLEYHPFFVLLGEAWAVSICYIPGSILYDHLTFLFLILALVFLYVGLIGDRDIFLALAGVMIGLNVFVRISNIPQVLLILAVWYYLFLTGSQISICLRKTFICIAGYLAAFLSVLAIISYKYVFNEYLAGITGMLNISGEAGDYSAGSMIKEVLLAYIHGGTRIVYIAVFALAGCLIYRCMSRVGAHGEKKPSDSARIKVIIAFVAAAMLVFMVIRKILIFDFYHYATLYYSTAFFLVVTVILCIKNITCKQADKEMKLISALILIQMLVMSIGSGTGISPVMNSAFIIGPFLSVNLQGLYKRYLKAPIEENRDITVYKRIIASVSFIAVTAFILQALAFGALYEFEEGGNGAGGKFCVKGNKVLGRVKTTEEKAGQMQGLCDYINSEGLSGKGVMIYGYAPALAFYLELEPVITTWPDLDSYGVGLMEEDISNLKRMIAAGDLDLPLIIIDEEGAREQRDHNPAKWDIISGFMVEYGYSPDYGNGRFTVFRCDQETPTS